MRNERVSRRLASGRDDPHYHTYTAGVNGAFRHAAEPVAWFNTSLQGHTSSPLFNSQPHSSHQTSSYSPHRLPIQYTQNLPNHLSNTQPSALQQYEASLEPTMSRFDKNPQEPLISRFDAFHRSKVYSQPVMNRNTGYHTNSYANTSSAPLYTNRMVTQPAPPTDSSVRSSLQASLNGRLNNHDHHHTSLSQLPSMDSVRYNEVNNRKSKMGPVIFLDIDGVLHPVQVTREYQLFRRDKMSLLRYLVQQSNASIVLSSAWRLAPRTAQIANQQLVRHGMDTYIDKTADHGYGGKRSAEILEWVNKYQPSAWIAIDDIDLACGEPRMMPHFIHTNPSIGLTAEQCELGLRMLRAGV